jgi:hypothetical protein
MFLLKVEGLLVPAGIEAQPVRGLLHTSSRHHTYMYLWLVCVVHLLVLLLLLVMLLGLLMLLLVRVWVHCRYVEVLVAEAWRVKRLFSHAVAVVVVMVVVRRLVVLRHVQGKVEVLASRRGETVGENEIQLNAIFPLCMCRRNKTTLPGPRSLSLPLATRDRPSLRRPGAHHNCFTSLATCHE